MDECLWVMVKKIWIRWNFLYKATEIFYAIRFSINNFFSYQIIKHALWNAKILSFSLLIQNLHSRLKDIKSLNTLNVYTWRYLNLVYVYIFFFLVSKSDAKNWWFSILKNVVLSMHIVFAALYLLEWRDFSEIHKISKLYYVICSIRRISFHFGSRNLGSVLLLYWTSFIIHSVESLFFGFEHYTHLRLPWDMYFKVSAKC